MTCNFRIGQKVVLVDDSVRVGDGIVPKARATRLGAKYPVKGCVYTVRDVRTTTISGEICLLLVELDNSHFVAAHGFKFEPGFSAWRFRPAVERGTDLGMSILRSLLNKTGKPVEVDA
ncbi:hypothetical protein GB928_018420 [Shinella curvata]|uniref:Uncharacterized protein n=1 Tax=Shinella curvata TaxID=1817964 RepID=A0ABT8XHL0_9HYPH|nr:hypothetical protein [Shinella curvata]MCJ8053835.1 hypothetical protein [Shinella curvata]MDO6123167.1 hypothetical protein [Shinella curvata]